MLFQQLTYHYISVLLIMMIKAKCGKEKIEIFQFEKGKRNLLWRRGERDGKKIFSSSPMHDLRKIYYKYCAFPWSPLFWKPNLFAIWLRSSVVSVLFSVTAEMSSLMTWNCYNIEFLEIGELVLNGLAHNQLAQCRCLHWLLTRKIHTTQLIFKSL